MDFEKGLQNFVDRLLSIKDSILTEEATKTALIMPFFALLGYDVFNPMEFIPEFIADVGIKKGEKVDYAILQNGVPMVLIEAKAVDKKLGKHDSQLFRYFGTSTAKFAILTNGIQYRFYTDLEDTNKMDALPFLQIDLLNLKNSQIRDLKQFCKSEFDVPTLLDFASILRYKRQFKEIFARQIENPTDDLVKLYLQDVYQGIKTQPLIAKFRPVLTQAFEEYINDSMNDRIKLALSTSNAPSVQSASPDAAMDDTSNEPESIQKRELTNEERIGFEKLKSILHRYINMEDLTFKTTDTYAACLYDGNTRKWICRLLVNGSGIYLILPDENKQEVKCYLSNWFEMENYGPYLISIVNRHTKLLTPFDCANVKFFTIDLVRRIPKRRKLPRMQSEAPPFLPCVALNDD